MKAFRPGLVELAAKDKFNCSLIKKPCGFPQGFLAKLFFMGFSF